MPKPELKTAYTLLFRGVGGATQLPVPNTARNRNTVLKLQELARKARGGSDVV